MLPVQTVVSLGCERIAGPLGGSVLALALVASDAQKAVIVGSQAGLFQAPIGLTGGNWAWSPLPKSPVNVTALAGSPDFEKDGTLFAGAQGGIYVSWDRGASWSKGNIPRESVQVLALSVSPAFAQDGAVFAATLEDGVFFSSDRGRNWQAWNFGLLDLSVLCLVVSPDFAKDETVFAGTESGLFYSYNGGRAWRELAFPRDAGAILSLAALPDLARDGVLFAGTEDRGLFRSSDRGRTWSTVDGLPGAPVNVLAISPSFPQDQTLLAATDEEIYRSQDGGKSWSCLSQLSDVLCLGLAEGLAVAGQIEQGLSFSTDLATWQGAPALATRVFEGVRLSPHFLKNETGFVFGPAEGLWQTRNGGASWHKVGHGLEEAQVRALHFSPVSAAQERVYIASAAGIWASADGGDSWMVLLDEPVERLAVAPDGKGLYAGTVEDRLFLSYDEGNTWESLATPWQQGSRVLDLALSSSHARFAAVLKPGTEGIELWEGDLSGWRKVHDQQVSNSLANLFIPDSYQETGIWFVALDKKVYRVDSRSGDVRDVVVTDAPVLHLTGVQDTEGLTLLAAAGEQIICSRNGQDWIPLLDLGPYRPVAVALSQSYSREWDLHVLTLGGGVWRLRQASV